MRKWNEVLGKDYVGDVLRGAKQILNSDKKPLRPHGGWTKQKKK